MGAVLKGTTFLSLVNGAWSALRNTAQPIRRFRLESKATLADVIRIFNLFEESVQDATIGSRSMPFGGPVAVFESVSFTSGQTVSLPNAIKSFRARVLLGAPSALSAGSPFATWSISADGTSIKLAASGTFTADVFVLEAP